MRGYRNKFHLRHLRVPARPLPPADVLGATLYFVVATQHATRVRSEFYVVALTRDQAREFAELRVQQIPGVDFVITPHQDAPIDLILATVGVETPEETEARATLFWQRENGPDDPSPQSAGMSEQMARGYDALAERRRR